MTRYADGPAAEVEVHVGAPAERVWALVTDVGLPARFSSEFQGGAWLGGATGPSLGACFRGRNRHPAVGEWETTCTVVACEPPLVFAWAVGDPQAPSATWRFEIVPDGEGVLLRQWARLGPGPSGLTPAIAAMPEKEERIVARRLEEHRANMQATVEGIKALAEAPGGSGGAHEVEAGPTAPRPAAGPGSPPPGRPGRNVAPPGQEAGR